MMRRLFVNSVRICVVPLFTMLWSSTADAKGVGAVAGYPENPSYQNCFRVLGTGIINDCNYRATWVVPMTMDNSGPFRVYALAQSAAQGTKKITCREISTDNQGNIQPGNEATTHFNGIAEDLEMNGTADSYGANVLRCEMDPGTILHFVHWVPR